VILPFLFFFYVEEQPIKFSQFSQKQKNVVSWLQKGSESATTLKVLLLRASLLHFVGKRQRKKENNRELTEVEGVESNTSVRYCVFFVWELLWLLISFFFWLRSPKTTTAKSKKK